MEKTKRERPTVTQVKELELRVEELTLKLNDQTDCTSKLIADCNLWREKYQKLSAEKTTLTKVNEELGRQLLSARNDLNALKQRSFWSRLFNR